MDAGQPVTAGVMNATPAATGSGRVFIGNVAWATTSEELAAVVAQVPGAGVPLSCEVARTRTGRSIGYAVAQLPTVEAAAAVIAALNDYELAGRRLVVREDRAPRKAVDSTTAPGVGKACHTCGEVGHLKRDCPQGGAGGDGAAAPKACHTCGDVGHLKRECPKNVGRAVDNSQKACHQCGEVGHIRRECPQNQEPRACHTCGASDHLKHECPQQSAN